MLTEAFGESAMSRTQVQLWYNRFKEGREDVKDHTGHPSTSTTNENTEARKKIILDNCRITDRLLMMLSYRLAHAKQFLRMF